MFIIFLGFLIIAFGRFAIKNPDSWIFRRIGDDSEPSDDYLAYTRFGGVVSIMMGSVIIIFGIQHLLI